MKRHWHLKALAFVIGLGLLFFGLHEAQTDPTLRVLKQVSIAEIERGELPKEDQYIQVNDAYLVGSYMIEYSHSRKHGDSAHVFAPLGSLAMQKLSSENKPLKPGLWVRLETDFRTKEAAEAAMQQDALYQKPYPVTGVVRSLESSVKKKMQEGGKPFQIGSSLFKGGIDNATEFGKRLRGHLFDLLAPPLAAKLQRGERVSFGPLSLNGLGIAKGKRGDDGEVLPWSEVGSATLKNGDLKIKQKGKMFGWGSFPAKKLLNVDVLMHLLQSKGL